MAGKKLKKKIVKKAENKPVLKKKADKKAPAKKATKAKKTTKKGDDEKSLSLLDQIEAKIQKDHGVEAVSRMGKAKNVPVAFSTGVPQLDSAIGIGGYPNNRIIEIFGPESSGKTTLALHAIAECQKNGGAAAFVDAEHALDTVYAENLGVDLTELLIAQPNSGEQGLDVVHSCLKINKLCYKPGVSPPNIVIVDSVAALTPKSEIEGEIGDPSVGVQARMMSQALRKICTALANSNTVLIFINQTRAKLDFNWGAKTNTTGGNSLKFYASIRIDIRRIGMEKDKKDDKSPSGNKTLVKVVKNKVGSPFVEFEGVIRFGVGFDDSRSDYERLLKHPEVESKGAGGSRITLPDGRKFCGFKEYREFISDEENSKYIHSLLSSGEV